MALGHIKRGAVYLAEQTNQEELAIRYLLGGLSEKEELALEEQLLTDDDVFENMEVAEGEVIDRYVRGELNETERRRIQEMILYSPRLAERVEIARIFARTVTSSAPQQNDPQPTEAVKPEKKKPSRNPWWNLFGPTTQMAPALRFLTVAPLVLLLLTSTALVLIWTRSRAEPQLAANTQQQIAQLRKQIEEQEARNNGLSDQLKQTQQERANIEQRLAELEQQSAKQNGQTPSAFFSFFLNPSAGTRSGGNTEQTISIPSGKTHLLLELNVEGGDYRRYVASMRDINLKEIARTSRLAPMGGGKRKFVPLKVPVSLIPPGSYMVHVDGILDDDTPDTFRDYQFKVTAR